MINTLQRLDFEGNCFYLKRDYGNYNSIERVDIHNKVLTIPVADLFQSKMMPSLSFRKVDHPSMVEKLVFLPDSIQIVANTANFPNSNAARGSTQKLALYHRWKKPFFGPRENAPALYVLRRHLPLCRSENGPDH